MFSVCPTPGGGGLQWSGPDAGGGVTKPGLTGGTLLGVPQPGGPTQVSPHQVRMGGTPARGIHPGLPPAKSGWWVPQPGGTHLEYPKPGQDGGTPARGNLHGVPPQQGYPPRDRTAHGVLDKRRSVCPLCVHAGGLVLL